MSSEITTAFVKQFGSNIYVLAQAKGSKLRNAVRVETVKGDSKFFDRIGKKTAVLRTSRHSDTPINDTPHTRRMLVLKDFEDGDMIDDQDKIRTLIDPTNAYVEMIIFALGRRMDEEIVGAANGNAYGGVAGATPVALPSTQKIASVASTAGAALNVQALRRAVRILDTNEVDSSIKRFCAFNAHQKEALLGQTEVTSADFNTVRALVMGEIDTFLGLKFILTERITDQSGALSFDTTSGVVGSGGGDADGYDQVLVWAMDGLILGIGEDIKSRVGERPDKGFNTQAYAKMTIGATRMEEEKVVQILCKDT